MRKAKKWAKVFSIFLLLSLVILSASSGLGEKKGTKGKGTKTPMNANAKWVLGDCAVFPPTSPLFSGDTKDTAICPHAGALIPSNNRGFFTHFGGCFYGLTFLGEDGLPGTPDDIEIVKGDLGATQDKNTGQVLTIRIWLYDLENNVYATEKIVLLSPVVPNPISGFRITVCQDNIPVYRQNKKQKGKGRPAEVGRISVGVIDFMAKVNN